MTTAAMNDDEDEFWQVALMTRDPRSPPDRDGDDDDDMAAEEETSDPAHTSQARLYELKEKMDPDQGKRSELKLWLSPLPASQGVYRPLGAEAWYGAALLCALLGDPNGRIQQHWSWSTRSLHDQRKGDDDDETNYSPIGGLTALELGSGAVGLSGLTLAWILSLLSWSPQGDGGVQQQQHCHRVILTDHDPAVLRQLDRNVQSNLSRLHQANSTPTMIQVSPLDWNDEVMAAGLIPADQPLRLVVGSELIYTQETADACTKLIGTLLDKYDHLLIVVVQYAHRDGWHNRFLPTLRQVGGRIRVEEAPVVDAHLHGVAQQLVQLGGTLDRFDYSVCYITNVQEMAAPDQDG